MGDLPLFRIVGIAASVALLVAPASARAEPSVHADDAPAPGVASGSTVRLGTAVGFVYGEPGEVLALGLTVAAGYRIDRLTVEAELSHLGFSVQGAINTPVGIGYGNISIGRGERLGVIARYEVLRFGAGTAGSNALFAVFLEGGAAKSWNHWTRPTGNEADRVVPDDTARVEGQAGFGVAMFPRQRVSWFIGLRYAVTPHQAMTGTSCRGTACRPVTMMDDPNQIADRSMLFQSSLELTY